ncbi:MAG TPA: RsmD family RNA methyltransferase [Micromonosporaceae bacterium]|nr:RsmD family RNA methyltransferase [Micromonosporaceae bacterium]
MTRIIAGTYGGRRLATPIGEDTRPTADRVREAMFSGLDAAHVLYGRRFLDLYAGSGAVGLEAASRGADHVLLVESDPRAVRVIRDNVAALDASDRATVLPSRVASALAAGPPAATPPVSAAPLFRGTSSDGAPTNGPGALARKSAPTNGPGASTRKSARQRIDATSRDRAPTGGPGASTSNSFDIVFADPPYQVSEVEITAMLAALVDRGWLNPGALIILERSKRSPAPTWVQSVTAERSRRYGETMLWYGRRS